MTEERGEVAPPGKVMLAALAFAGSLLPAGTRPVSYLAHDLAVPDLVQGVVLSLLAAGAIWLTPRRCWPLFAITVIGWLLRSDWPVLAITSYLAASTYRRSPRLLGYAVAAAALAFVSLFAPTALIEVAALATFGAALANCAGVCARVVAAL